MIALEFFIQQKILTPNFNLCDYAIANDGDPFGDRYHRLSSF